MFFFFIVLAIMGCCFQLYMAKSSQCLKESKKGCKECDCSMHLQVRFVAEYFGFSEMFRLAL